MVLDSNPMIRPKKIKKLYTAHRRSQREKILEVAEELFIEKGIEPVTMADIAAASRLTRATIYKYFPNRTKVAFEIYKNIMSGWHERNKLEVWEYPGNGFQKIEKFLMSFCDYMLRSPKEIRFVAEFNYRYAKEWPSSQVLETLQKSLGEDRNLMLKCIRQGISDGSLRQDLEAKLILAALFNLNSSLLGRLGQMGGKLKEEFGVNAGQIMNEIYRLFIDGIRGNSVSREKKQKARPRAASSQKRKSPKI